MTDDKWLKCDDLMLFAERIYAKELKRKRYLYCAACCRRIWASMADERCRTAVVKTEQYADGLVTQEEFEMVERQIKLVGNDAFQALVADKSALTNAAFYSACATCAACRGEPGWAIDCAVSTLDIEDGLTPLKESEWAAQLDLAHDLLDNIFRRIRLESSWLEWQGGAIFSLAQSIYETGSFEALPSLADALEDAGCNDADILAHCRSKKPHAKGCWVLDLILQKA